MTKEQKEKLIQASHMLEDINDVICGVADELDAVPSDDEEVRDIVNLLEHAADQIGWAIHNIDETGVFGL